MTTTSVSPELFVIPFLKVADEYFAESNAAIILPELLDRLIALGERARQISHALGNSGHRPEVAAALIGYLKHQAHK